MKKVGMVGWRGMVGSVLMERMSAQNDFQKFTPVFFTTSQAGQTAPDVGQGASELIDAFDIDTLMEMDIVVTCQGGSYTESVRPKLAGRGWEGTGLMRHPL